MTRKRTIPVDGPALIKARIARGLRTPADLAEHLRKKQVQISLDTIERCEGSTPDARHEAYSSTIRTLADELGVAPETLMAVNVPAPGSGARIRDCSGIWTVRGGDIRVPGHFDYPAGPKTLEARVKVQVQGVSVNAEGHDHDNDPLHFWGRLEESGNHIVGQYEVVNDRLHVYGTVNLQFLGCGQRMHGYYLGRETGHGGTYILGMLEMVLERLLTEEEGT